MKKYNPKSIIGKGEYVSHNGKTYMSLRSVPLNTPPNNDKFYWAYVDEETLDKPVTIPKDETEDKPIIIPRDNTPDTPIVIPHMDSSRIIERVVIVKDKTVKIEEPKTSTPYISKIGIDGTPGNSGVGLDFRWDGTKLGVKRENETYYQFVDLKGAEGKHISGGGGSSQRFRLYASDTGETLVQGVAKPHAATLKGLVAGSNITLTPSSDAITIASTSSGVPQSNFSIVY